MATPGTEFVTAHSCWTWRSLALAVETADAAWALMDSRLAFAVLFCLVLPWLATAAEASAAPVPAN